jgi:hypothetical protein
LSAPQAEYVFGTAPVPLTVSGGSGSGAVSFSSSDSSVISVSSTGFVAFEGVGIAEITATKAASAGYLSATAALTITVTPRNIGNAVITITNTPLYNGEERSPTFTVTDIVGSANLIVASDYTVSFSGDRVNAGATATLILTGQGNYIGTISQTFTIAKAPPTYSVPSGLEAVFGDTLGSVSLPSGWTWDENITTRVGNAGSQSHSATFTPQYPQTAANFDTVTRDLTITVGRRDLSSASVSVSGTFTYTGAAITPVPSVSDGTPNLITSGDFTVSHSNNINAGTAAVTITATAGGNYAGSATAAFEIDRASLTFTPSGALSPIDDVTLTVSGLVDGDSLTLTHADFTVSGTTVQRISADATADTITASVTFDTGNPNYTANPTELNIRDGRAAGARAIPVTQENIGRFNAFANTAAGAARNYVLISDIEAVGAWTPIGGGSAPMFTGSFDGSGHVIEGITVNTPNADDVGMFGAVGNGGTIRNLGLLNVDINGRNNTGGVAGRITAAGAGIVSTIENCFVTGTVTGNNNVGGIVGAKNQFAGIANCVALLHSVTGNANVGRVIGENLVIVQPINNYAWSGIGGSTSEFTAVTRTTTHKDGADLSAAQIADIAAWNAANFDFTAVWEWLDGFLPRSRNSTAWRPLPAYLFL